MERTEPKIDSDWYKLSFGELYPVIYAHRTIESAAAESRFAAEQVGIQPGQRVLDLCCGNGRHLVHLHGYTDNAVGLDYSAELLGMAQSLVDAQLVRADMRAIPFAGELDAVVNFFTSFGYFEAADENRAVVEGVAYALKPGGRFLIDYVNPVHARATLVPNSEREQDGYLIHEKRWVDESVCRLNKSTTVTHDGRICAELGESVQLYTQEALIELLGSAGLTVTAIFGDTDGAAFDDENSPRMVVVGLKQP